MDALFKYTKQFNRLRVARVRGEKAPHKPVLLLAVIEGFERRDIQNNQIHITSELVARFKDYWHQLVQDPRFTANFSLPFYHLQSDNFWHFQTCVGKEILLTSSHSIKSFAHLKEVVDYAYLDEELFRLLLDDHSRQVLKQTLLNTYFANVHLEPNKLVEEIINQILHEPSDDYKRKAEYFDEEEVFVRSGIFKKEIPRIYNYTCSISEMRIIVDAEVQMIDACHIVPFSESRDDTITNGISLCPNLHRAFDRGLISIDDDYRVVIKPFFEQDNVYSIRQFEGKRILLPSNINYVPSKSNLAAHRYKHGFISA